MKDEMKNLFKKLIWLICQCKLIAKYLFSMIILGILASLASVYRSVTSKYLIDYATNSEFAKLYKYLFIMCLMIFIEIGFNSIINILLCYCQAKLSSSIQKRLYSHIIYSNFTESSKYHSGDLLTRITSDVATITSFIVNTIQNTVSLIVLLIASFVALLSFQPMMAIILILIAPISILISRIFGHKLKNLYLKIQETESSNTSFIQESMQNSVIIKTFCIEKNNIYNYKRIQNAKLKLSLSKGFISSLYNIVLYLGYWGSYFLVFCFGALNISNGTTTFGTLTALLQLTANIQGPLSELGSSFSSFITTLASVERVMAIENIALENSKLSYDYSDLETINSVIIEFKNTTFQYIAQNPVLKNVCLSIFPGEIVALIGRSGEGKTTFIKLLLSLINNYNGEINIISEKKSIKVSPETRYLISYVPQGNTLFSGSVEDNLRYGYLDATNNELEQALKSACAWDFVNKLQHNIHTIIGEKGLGLSEGQAQRVAIARALLRKKPILILDEATSALDETTEMEILQAIKCLDYKPTCIIITHRPSALSICTRILRLEHGIVYEAPINNEEKTEKVDLNILKKEAIL